MGGSAKRRCPFMAQRPCASGARGQPALPCPAVRPVRRTVGRAPVHRLPSPIRHNRLESGAWKRLDTSPALAGARCQLSPALSKGGLPAGRSGSPFVFSPWLPVHDRRAPAHRRQREAQTPEPRGSNSARRRHFYPPLPLPGPPKRQGLIGLGNPDPGAIVQGPSRFCKRP